MGMGKLTYLLILSGLLLMPAGCAAPEELATPTPLVASSPDPSPASTPTIVPSITPTSPPPFYTAWQASPHANPDALAFRFWDDAEPALIPTACARCHSTAGYLDYLGADGSTPGVVDAPAEPGLVIECFVCHNDATKNLDSVSMPSGAELTGLGTDALCVQCHQGLASGLSLKLALKSLAPNGISPALEFLSIHDAPAGAVLFGSEASGGYEYPGHAYAGRFSHSPGFNACTDCHDAHGLEVKIETCVECHPGITTLEDIRTKLRLSTIDYDGDGLTSEGVALEIETLRANLLDAIQAYAAKAGSPLVYRPGQDPHFFNETGEVYSSWTPVLLEAAYNYHLATMDPGAYSHNPRYILQLLYDSIEGVGGSVVGLIRP
jgi:hypothetical protein